MRYDLGGTGRQPGGRLSVNLSAECDVRHDFTDLDGFIAEDGQVQEFLLRHALEHVPIETYLTFLQDLHRKLRPGGQVIVVQTDAALVIKQWLTGGLSFRAMRATLFTPASRVSGNQYQRHHNMWSADELVRDFDSVGFQAVTFEAGGWTFDMVDQPFEDDFRRCHGASIANLGVRAVKPALEADSTQ